MMSNDETKQNILIEAEKLFMKYGIKSVTMDDIAKTMGMSKKTIYVNFKDKNELVHELFSTMFLENNACVKKCAEEAENAVYEVFAMMKFLKERIANINPIVFYDLQKYHFATNTVLTEFKRNYILKQITASLERGINEGLFREDLNIEILANARLAQIDWGFECELVRSGKFSLYDVFLETTFHFLRGITTDKGNELIKQYKENTNTLNHEE